MIALLNKMEIRSKLLKIIDDQLKTPCKNRNQLIRLQHKFEQTLAAMCEEFDRLMEQRR